MNADLLEERLHATADAVDVPPGMPLDELHRRARARRRRRQGANTLGALSILAIAGWGATQVIPLPEPGVVVSAPEQLPDLAIADHTLWVSPETQNATEAAEAFASAAFGWHATDVTLLLSDDPRELSPDGGEIAELTGLEGQVIEIVMVPADGDADEPGMWRVGQVGPHLWDIWNPEHGTLQLGAPEANHAVVQFATDHGQQHRTTVELVAGQATALDLTRAGLDPSSDLAAALVVYLDEEGTVVDAVGGVLDPGHQ